METNKKTHKTEVILAIITASTGILVAIFANWEKIFPCKDVKPITVTDTVYIGNGKRDVEKLLDEDSYSLIARSYIDAKNQRNDGWEIEHLHLENLEKGSSSYYFIELLEGYTYAFDVYSLDSLASFKITLNTKDESVEDLIFEIDNKIQQSINIKYDVESFFVESNTKDLIIPYSLLVTSKKT